MKIALACDHGAFDHKEAIREELLKRGFEIEDFGCYSSASVDYPDTVYPAVKSVALGKNEFGVVLCGTGIGASIVANKVKGIRCALVYDTQTAAITREHNNTNVLAMGGRLVTPDEAVEIALTWLNTLYPADPRHQRRIDKITAVEAKEGEHDERC
ncbi:MAG: ribose-5-phosphate isomerase [Firmicutes bacterium GWF2_51_9]|nr:MAG: ribose-5-phosphate isomerase [Firmicutes bacterium GWF2_51_9]OGS58663.1 MAG: ribose-5-phosphate isomerase [Firmicutes bacterium GWE2_51_13]HAM62558.1 ribose-5-phosphate isomerase [Erysipelotrichaceae bacterium]HBZ40428.1 ribose-5-phosphate isomerase [Erysipelotrichaceae bacterium]